MKVALAAVDVPQRQVRDDHRHQRDEAEHHPKTAALRRRSDIGSPPFALWPVTRAGTGVGGYRRTTSFTALDSAPEMSLTRAK